MRRRAFLGWLTTLASQLLVACQTVPYTGRSQLMLVSEADEQRMGAQAYRQILGKSRLSRDWAQNEQVTRVGRRIAEATGRRDFRWEFRVIDDDRQVNAFALPGGKVAVYTGILPITRDDAGLAAVLGHEIAHAVARHGGERVSQQVAIQGGLDLTMAALSGGNPQTVRTMGSLLGAGAAVGLILPWSREQESEADHLGLSYMGKAGYDPHAARDLWIRMAEAARGQSRPPEFLSTHPADVTRIRQIEQWLPEALQYYQASPYRS
jgi:metalloendopeptidase OMA1, mitochondrial